MGNVYTSIGSVSFRVHQKGLTDFDYMVHAAGFGIRYRTPLGPVRVDLAYSINPPTFNGLQGTYQQLLFGGATKTVMNVRPLFSISFPSGRLSNMRLNLYLRLPAAACFLAARHCSVPASWTASPLSSTKPSSRRARCWTICA